MSIGSQFQTDRTKAKKIGMLLNKFGFLIMIGSAVILIMIAAACTGPAASIGVTSTPKVFLPLIENQTQSTETELPDLIVPYVSITLENATCYDGSAMGIRARVQNIGLGHAGPFVVEIDNGAITVDGLAAGESTSVWLPGTSSQPLVVADATDLVEESNEENNTFNELVPIPTLPLPCDLVTKTPPAQDAQD